MKGAKSKDAAKVDAKLVVKSKGAKKPTSRGRKGKAGKDPNKPKRASSAFFVFMEEFRKEFKEKNPKNKSVVGVGKTVGDRWKSLSDAGRAVIGSVKKMMMEKLVRQCDMEVKKMAILKHEETFRQQVHELHRLCCIQRQLISDLTELS